MFLTKKVPSHNKTIVAKWCKKDFCKYDESFRNIRAKSKNKMDKCYWCKHHFEDGEMIALACFENTGGNKVLCQTCAGELLKTKET